MNHNSLELQEWGTAVNENSARPVVRFLVGLAVVAALLACAAPRTVFGQAPGSDAAKQIRQRNVDDLIKGLIDRGMGDFSQPMASDPIATQVIRDLPNVPEASVQQIRRALADFASEAEQLTRSLSNDLDYLPAVRPLFGDMLQIRAAASVLQEKSKLDYNRQVIGSEFISLDSQWRVLSYKLRQVQNLDKVCLQRIDKLDVIDRSLCDLIKVKGQVKHRELAASTASLAVHLQNLREDLEIELEPSDTRTNLVLTTQQLRQQAEHISDVILEQARYEEIVAEYKKFQEIWYAHAVKLRSIESRYVENNVRRVAETDRNIHELLWLPQQVDSSQLLHLADSLKKSVDEYFTRAPLKLLIELPNREQALTTADAFYGVCQNFTDCVQNGNPRTELIDAFRFINDEWRSFDRMFRPLKSSKAQLVLNQIDETISALRNSLYIQNEQFDRDVAVELAAGVANISEHIDYQTERWLSKKHPSYEAEARAATQKFLVRSRKFHENLVRGASVSQLRKECAELYEQWRVVYDYIRRCDSSERPQLGSLAAKTTPALVELRTMLEL